MQTSSPSSTTSRKKLLNDGRLNRKHIALHPDVHHALALIARKNKRKITDQIAFWIANDKTP